MVSLSLGLQVDKGNYVQASKVIATFPPRSSSGKREHHLASLVPRTAGVVIHYEILLTSHSLINMHQNFSIRILDQQSISPKQATWWGAPALRPSPDISWTRPSSHPVSSLTWWLMRVWYSERNTFVRKNVGRNAACSIRSALALYFSLNQDLSFLRGVSPLLDNITTTPMSLATRQMTTPVKKSLTPLSDIDAAWRPHLEQKKYRWMKHPIYFSSGA